MEIRSVESFLDYWRSVRSRTSRVIAAIPHDRFDWSYREEKFTFADLIRHLAALERYMFAENVCGRPSRYPGHGRELADSPDAVLDLFDRLHSETIELLQALPDERLHAYCETPAGTRLKVWKWLRAMIEHEVHHRGQIYTYLSLLGLPSPPLYGLTSEEVREHSQPFD
ncbi:MAG: DinB family protein [Gemmatimonadota bacterium]